MNPRCEELVHMEPLQSCLTCWFRSQEARLLSDLMPLGLHVPCRLGQMATVQWQQCIEPPVSIFSRRYVTVGDVDCRVSWDSETVSIFSRRYVTVGDVDCGVSWDSKTGGEAGKLASAHRWLDYKHSAVVLAMYRWLWTRSHLLCAWFLLSLLAQECVSLVIGCRSLMPHILILGIVLQEWNL